MLNAYNYAGSLLPAFNAAADTDDDGGEHGPGEHGPRGARSQSWRLAPSPPNSSGNLATNHQLPADAVQGGAGEEKQGGGKGDDDGVGRDSTDLGGAREAGGVSGGRAGADAAGWEGGAEESKSGDADAHRVYAPNSPLGAVEPRVQHAHRSSVYHPLAKMNHKRGYWGSLNIEQEDRLRSFAERITRNGHEAGVREVYARALDVAEGAFGNAYERLLLRFLRARDFNGDEALDMLLEDVEWRREEGVEDLARLAPADVLQTTRLDELWSTGHQSWFGGFDEQERPVVFAKYGETEIWKSKEIVSLDNLLRLHIWEQEQASILCETRSSETGYLVETFVMVLDLDGMSIRQVTRDFLMLVKSSASLDQAHYPERLGQIYVINTPMMFGTVWSGIRPWLSKDTQDKIHVLPTPQQWQPVLLQVVWDQTELVHGLPVT